MERQKSAAERKKAEKCCTKKKYRKEEKITKRVNRFRKKKGGLRAS